MGILKKDGAYLVDVRPKGSQGRRIRKKFRTRGEALDYERHIIAQAGNKAWIEQPADRRLFSELVELWYQHHGVKLKTGVQCYRRLMMFCEHTGQPKASQITRALFSDYRAKRLADGAALATLNKIQAMVSGVFSALIENEQYFNENPLSGFKKIKLEENEMGFLSMPDIEKLLENLSDDTRKAAQLCLATGARWSEAAELKREYLIKYKVIFVQTKNGKTRSVPISPYLYNELATDSAFIMPMANYEEMKRTVKRLFPWLPRGQASHVLRHTFASHFMQQGGSIITLQRILGHATINQTMVYAHFSPDHLKDAEFMNPIAAWQAKNNGQIKQEVSNSCPNSRDS